MKMKSCFLKQSIIVIFWTAIIVLFLFVPHLLRMQPEKSITLFTWPLVINTHVLTQFENETGIKIYLSYYDNNEELYSKLKKSGAKGYDLVIPTDYTVAMLVKDGLLKEIDKSKLDFIGDLDPRVVGHYYDPDNTYSLPYHWGVYGVGINKTYFGGKTPPATWGLLFDRSLVPAPIAMTNAPREAIMIAAQYLFGSIESLQDPEKRKHVQELLVKQKQWVQLYNEARTEDLLLSHSCPVIAAMSPDVWKAKKDVGTDYIAFVKPEKSFVFIDSFVIPKASKKDDLVYTLLNYLYQPDIIKHNGALYGSCSPIKNVELKAPPQYCPSLQDFANLDFFRDVVPVSVIDDIWITLMAH